jgi:hypothetical protein
MKSRSCLLLVVVLVSAGCGRKADQPAKAPAPGGSPVTAPVDYLGAVSKAKLKSERDIEVISLNQTLQQFHAIEGRFPKTLNELVERGYLPRDPIPPKGTRFLYHADRGQVELLTE